MIPQWVRIPVAATWVLLLCLIALPLPVGEAITIPGGFVCGLYASGWLHRRVLRVQP